MASPTKQPIDPNLIKHKLICEIFKITIQPISDPTFIVLSNFKNLDFFLIKDTGKILDYLCDIFSKEGKNSPSQILEYLISCYRRLKDKENYLSPGEYHEILTPISNFLTLIIKLPERFNINNIPYTTTFIQNQPNDPLETLFSLMSMDEKPNFKYDWKIVPREWANYFISQILFDDDELINEIIETNKSEEESLTIIFEPIFEFIFEAFEPIKIDNSSKLIQMTTIIYNLVKHKELAEVFVTLPNFKINLKNSATRIEKDTILGRMLKLNLFPTNLEGAYMSDLLFKNISPSKHGIEKEIRSISDRFFQVHKIVAEIIIALVKAGPKSANMIWDWIYSAISLNFNFIKIMSSASQLSTHAFIHNLLGVMLIICSPFISKYENFIAKSKLINSQFIFTKVIPLEKLERITDDKNIVPSIPEKDFHFVTKCFYCTHFLIAYLYNHLEKRYIQLLTDLSSLRETNIQEFRKLLNKKFGFDAHLNNEEYLTNLSNFCHFSVFWILKNLSDKIEDSSEDFISRLSLKTFSPIITKEFCLIPEIILNNINDIGIFYQLQENIKFFTKPSFLRDLSILYSFLFRFPLLKNPHLKAELITLFSRFIMSIENNKDHNYFSYFVYNDTIGFNIIDIIINLYCLVEKTGSHSQFYEKFTYRKELLSIFDFYWKIKKYNCLEQFINAQEKNSETFIAFLNFLLHDLSFCFDEAIESLTEIKKIDAMKDENLNDYLKLNAEEKKEIDENYSRKQSSARAVLQNGNQIVKSLALITEICKEPFLRKEVIELFTNMINYCIDSLVIKKGGKIKVKSPSSYHFKPDFLLEKLVEIYINMSHFDNFALQISNDKRSYSPELFAKVISIITSGKRIKFDSESIKKFEQLAEKVKELRNKSDSEENLYNDAPEEFIDPLMLTLMEDPVKLPTSNVIMDYNNIKIHLMSDPTDPYNRKPLSMEMLIPCKELKAKIIQYKNSKKNMK